MFLRFKKQIVLGVLALVLAAAPGTVSLRAQEAGKQLTVAQEDRVREKESGQETDPSEALRNSPAVRGLARMTGMSSNQAYWVSVAFNFLIVVAVLVFLLRKSLPAAFKARNESIQRRVEEARKSSEEARRRLSDVEGRLSRLDAEIAGMRSESEESARAEEERILTESEAERRRIVSSAEQEIAAAAGNARRELKAYAAALAVDLAEQKIKIGKDADQTLVREFTAQLGKDGR